MAANQPKNSQGQSAGPEAGKTTASSFFKFGPRETLKENWEDVSKALGLAVLLNGGTNLILIVITLIISLRYPDLAPFFFSGVTAFDLLSLFQFFLSTFPLMLATTVLTILILTGKFKQPLLIPFVLMLAIMLGQVLGLGGISWNDIEPRPHPFQPAPSDPHPGSYAFDLTVRIVSIFFTKYGAYRFFTSLFTGVVIAWSVCIKLFGPAKSDNPKKP